MSYMDTLGNEDRAGIIRRAGTIAIERISGADYDGDTVNEIRANWGQAAVMVGCPDYARGHNGIETDIKDALSNIVHFCRRAGVDPNSVFDRSLDAADGDLEDGTEAARDEFNFPEDAH